MDNLTPEEQKTIRFVRFNVSDLQFSVADQHWGNESITKELNLEFNYKPILEEIATGKLTIEFLVRLSLEDQSFLLNLTAIALFHVKGLSQSDEQSAKIATQNAPAIVFPYIRSTISILTQQLGFSPVMLPTYNFTKIIESRL